MSMWQLAACVEGYMDANAPEDPKGMDRPTEAEFQRIERMLDNG